MSLPKILYRVVIKRGDKKGKLRFYQKGGGTYSQQDHAFGQAQRLLAKEIGVKVFQARVTWEEIPEEVWRD